VSARVDAAAPPPGMDCRRAGNCLGGGRYRPARSGKDYATPVVADHVGDGIILPLPYGTGVDWLSSVLAAGRGYHCRWSWL
jgi:hypothetical protein